ncbi:hypothetical protein JVT61DRAFT_6965 [Boletus reticuloceps]|uniref:Uncharacterized protein n=1 Tax=Boletus reticuloceps TaxID=495285 RepID=A0A8I3A6A8_9AGAM|nr:hypothetical protein JVT61DRAFT_6965 [Boletus reticuloceps]
MSTLERVDEHALHVSARLQAALTIIPQLVGPRHTWVLWMRDHIERELASGLNYTKCLQE